ncbi:MAG: phosphoenolpyruvate--protein phosphotransferase [Coprococcus sp.]
MEIYHGKTVFAGIAIGQISVYQRDERQVKRKSVEDTEAELDRYYRARKVADSQLKSLYEKAVREVGENHAAIFQVHQMMLEDDDFNESVENIIRIQKVNAEYAVASTGDNYSQIFAAMEDDYMRERAADVRDVSGRILSVLAGNDEDSDASDGPVILVADDLAPSETVQLEKNKILAFVTVQGSLNSHTAILAKTMGIPALVGTKMPFGRELEGQMAVVDGFNGILYVDPNEELLEEMKKRKKEDEYQRTLLQALKGMDNVTRDGKRIELYANIGNLKDMALALQNDAGGIGLFRSEFIYLESQNFPTEEEQFRIYKAAAEAMGGRKVIIRTLDIGADKQCEYFHLEHEENPAMGLRAIRICLSRPEIFRTQLRAIYRASAYGKIAIMYPMIISLEEVRMIKAIAEEVREELISKGIACDNVEQGIMIETPAAAVMSDELANEVDFFSIGTNDLTQYTLAIDRQNAKLDAFYDEKHPAVLRQIEMIIKNAHKAGIWAGICGELGADTSLTEKFLAMGIDELSVSPGHILPVRKAIRETDLSK